MLADRMFLLFFLPQLLTATSLNVLDSTGTEDDVQVLNLAHCHKLKTHFILEAGGSMAYATLQNVPFNSHDTISLCAWFKTPTLASFAFDSFTYGEQASFYYFPKCDFCWSQSFQPWSPWWSLSRCPTGRPPTVIHGSTKAALLIGRLKLRHVDKWIWIWIFVKPQRTLFVFYTETGSLGPRKGIWSHIIG